MLPLVLGTATVVAPQFGLPVLAGLGTVKGIRSILKQKKKQNEKREVSQWQDVLSGAGELPGQIVLEWRDLKCTLAVGFVVAQHRSKFLPDPWRYGSPRYTLSLRPISPCSCRARRGPRSC